jgi:hypothetical protein
MVRPGNQTDPTPIAQDQFRARAGIPQAHTRRYSPTNPRHPDYSTQAKVAIERFVREINEHIRKLDTLKPFARAGRPSPDGPHPVSLPEQRAGVQ